jgi:hypothetical protein
MNHRPKLARVEMKARKPERPRSLMKAVPAKADQS